MHITYHNTTPLGFTFDDLQRICYHLQRAAKENRLVNKDMGTLLKVKTMMLMHEEAENECRKFHGDPDGSDCR
mgnify:FL=1